MAALLVGPEVGISSRIRGARVPGSPSYPVRVHFGSSMRHTVLHFLSTCRNKSMFSSTQHVTGHSEGGPWSRGICQQAAPRNRLPIRRQRPRTLVYLQTRSGLKESHQEIKPQTLPHRPPLRVDGGDQPRAPRPPCPTGQVSCSVLGTGSHPTVPGEPCLRLSARPADNHVREMQTDGQTGGRSRPQRRSYRPPSPWQQNALVHRGGRGQVSLAPRDGMGEPGPLPGAKASAS